MGFGRGFARLVALALLSAAAAMFIVTTVNQPTINNFEFVKSRFLNGPQSPDVIATMRVGMWGYCVEYPNQPTVCPKSKLGFYILDQYLPPVIVEVPDPDARQLMNYKLAGALLLVPLTVGQILLTLLVAIIPIRFFSLVALLFGAASAGIAMLSALIGMLTYIPLNDRIRQQWSTSVDSQLSTGMWLLLSATVCAIFAPLFLWMAVIPPKKKAAPPLTYDVRDPSEYDEEEMHDRGADPAKSFRTSKYASSKPVDDFSEPLDRKMSDRTTDRKSYGGKSGRSDRVSYVEDGREKHYDGARSQYQQDNNGVFKRY